jgi:small-conductance mechanosensitive channel
MPTRIPIRRGRRYGHGRPESNGRRRARSAWRGHRRRGITLLALTAAAVWLTPGIFKSGAAAANPPAQSGVSAQPPGIIPFLEQTIGWYRQLAVEQQAATEPDDAVVVRNDQQTADQVVQLAFEFARAQTTATPKAAASNQGANENSDSTQYRALSQMAARADQDVKDLQGEVESVKQKLATASGRKRQDLASNLAETQSELQLAQARRDALSSMTEFVAGANTNGLGASGQRAQIEALARTVPGALEKPAAGKETGNATAEPVEPAPISGTRQPSGIWGLGADLFTLSRKIHTLDGVIRSTDALTQSSNQLRAPFVRTLKDLARQGDDLAKQADTADPATLEQEKKQLDAITAQFKQTSALALPLSKLGVLLTLYRRSLTDWQGRLGNQYQTELRSLVVRLVMLGLILGLVIGLAEVWRRTIFRYVHDPRRRYQFLLLRRILLWFAIAIIIAFAFASELGSVATFAGLLTAGVAFALQSVILSVAGYFFLIGRFGIRVGDRVQIAGVTGEVVEIGLVRLHLMELGSAGADTPSGRVVAFPNSVVFQSTAGLFKQIPGTNFVWHELTLTLSPDSDYGAVEERVHEAEEAVFSDYREEMERQKRQMERTLTSTSVSALWPRSRLHPTPAGLQVIIRFPVDSEHASEIDNRLTLELLKALDREPALKAAGSDSPTVKLRTDLSSSATSS